VIKNDTPVNATTDSSVTSNVIPPTTFVYWLIVSLVDGNAVNLLQIRTSAASIPIITGSSNLILADGTPVGTRGFAISSSEHIDTYTNATTIPTMILPYAMMKYDNKRPASRKFMIDSFWLFDITDNVANVRIMTDMIINDISLPVITLQLNDTGIL
jgi:hypothetical protein